MIFKENGPATSCSCGNKRFYDLLHILNNYAYNLKEMTVRHNMIQEVLGDAMRKHRKISTEEILVNQEIDFGMFRNDLGNPNLSGDEVKQKPDIQFWANITKEGDIFEAWKLFIIEKSVPFGKGDKEDEHSNTLKKVIEFKTNKYSPLLRRINKQLKEKNIKKRKCEIEFLPFIISSLGALPNKSINNFSRMIGAATKNKIGLWCKKLVVKVLKRSFTI
jgi:hypothetical protein